MNNFEQEISLKDLYIYILKFKKYIYLSFVLGFFFCGLLACVSIYKNISIDKKVLEEQKENYKIEKKLLEKEIEDLTYIVEQADEDISNSLLLNYNPYITEEINMDIFLDVKELDILADNATNLKMNELIKKYMNEALSPDIYKKLEDKFNINKKYLGEVLSVGADYSSSSFFIKIISDNRKEAENILSFIYENLKDNSDNVLSQYTITNSNLRIYSKNSDEIKNIQENFYKKKAENLKKLKNKKNSYKDLDDKYLHHNMSKRDVLKKIMKLGVLGSFIAFIVSLVIMISLYLISDTIKTEFDIEKIFGYFYLGKTKKDYDVISVLISKRLKGSKNILLVGTISDSKLEKVSEELASRLDKYKISYVSEIYNKSIELKKQDEYDAIILVEEVNKSNLNLIKRQIQVLEKNVSAYIIFEK